MVGTNAYAVIEEQGDRRARVLDLGFGGVALELEGSKSSRRISSRFSMFQSFLPFGVFLKTVWTRRTSGGAFRLGCHFIS